MKLRIGKQIRANRIRLGLTQEQLAQELATSPQSVSRWENGATYPDLEMLPAIASFFEITVDTLLSCSSEDKEQFCSDLQKRLSDAVKERNEEKIIFILREIRRNLHEYREYWFWGIYQDFWQSGLFENELILDEMRLLTQEIFKICPRDQHFAVIEQMACMEKEENINSFLDKYSCREDQSKSRLLFSRYKEREELKKIEPIRKFILWFELDHILTAADEWQEYLCNDPAHFKWFCETQLNYLNAINCLKPDETKIISGGGELDLWSEARVLLGLRYVAALTRLGENNAALNAFDDLVSLVERIMNIKSETFKIGCKSPALKGFTSNCEFCWVQEDDKEYRDLCLQNDNWNGWIIPRTILREIETGVLLGPIAIEGNRFNDILKRLKKCVVFREKKTSE